MSSSHGYVAYTRGCRCGVCRRAKADYIRERRAAARAIAQRYTRSSTGRRGTSTTAWAEGAIRYVAIGVTHGTRYAYDERGCRCRACCDKKEAWRQKDAA